MAQSQGAHQGQPVEHLPEGYLDIYKLSVEMADRVSARRAVASSFFLTVQAALVSVIGVIGGARWSLALAGIVLAVTWWFLLRSYRLLNGAKFDVIHSLETRLPAAPFTDEWRILKKEDPIPFKERYTALGPIEQVVPAIFFLINAGVLLSECT